MSAEKSPAFQFYPREFMADLNVMEMSDTEVGVYLKLMCICWLEQALPQDPARLAKMVKWPPRRFEKMWQGPLSRCFHDDGHGHLRHPRLDKEREKQASFSRHQSDKGKASAVARANQRTTDRQPPLNRGSTVVEPARKESGEIRSFTERESERKPDREQDFYERAGKLRQDLYPAWYSKYRHGAKLRLIASHLEFEDALSIVRSWDDDTIEKLAVIVLTTDDEWISRTDRSFRIFCLKASWAHDRLCQEEMS